MRKQIRNFRYVFLGLLSFLLVGQVNAQDCINSKSTNPNNPINTSQVFIYLLLDEVDGIKLITRVRLLLEDSDF